MEFLHFKVAEKVLRQATRSLEPEKELRKVRERSNLIAKSPI